MITGKRWFNSTQGNTYFSAVAYLDGIAVSSIDYAYGYGNQYEYEMFAKLAHDGLLTEPLETRDAGRPAEAPWRYCQRLGINYAATVTDVRRKKDL